MLKERVLTALVLLPLVLYCVFSPNQLLFSGFSALLLVVGAWEWTMLMGWRDIRARMAYVLLVAVVVLALGRLAFVHGVSFSPLWFAGSALLWCLAVPYLKRYPQVQSWHQPGLMPFWGLWLLIPTWLALLTLKNLSTAWLVYLFLLVWGADTGAYFAGRRFGRRKLAVRVSPGKTIEGLLGGLALTTALAVGVALLRHMSLVHAVLFVGLSLLTVLASVLGDLLESMVKRACGVKDSGGIFPGHGGVLDRIDSLTAAAPVFVLGWLWLGGF